MGSDTSGHIVNCCRRLHPTLACPWPGGNSPRLYRRTPFGKGPTLDERRLQCIGPGIAAVDNARAPNEQCGSPVRWGTFGGRRRQQRFLKGRRMDGSSADVAKNPGRHAPQRTSATGEIAVSLPINIVALVKAHRPQCRVLESGAPNSAETGFGEVDGKRFRADVG